MHGVLKPEVGATPSQTPQPDSTNAQTTGTHPTTGALIQQPPGMHGQQSQFHQPIIQNAAPGAFNNALNNQSPAPLGQRTVAHLNSAFRPAPPSSTVPAPSINVAPSPSPSPSQPPSFLLPQFPFPGLSQFPRFTPPPFHFSGLSHWESTLVSPSPPSGNNNAAISNNNTSHICNNNSVSNNYSNSGNNNHNNDVADNSSNNNNAQMSAQAPFGVAPSQTGTSSNEPLGHGTAIMMTAAPPDGSQTIPTADFQDGIKEIIVTKYESFPFSLKQEMFKLAVEQFKVIFPNGPANKDLAQAHRILDESAIKAGLSHCHQKMAGNPMWEYYYPLSFRTRVEQVTGKDAALPMPRWQPKLEKNREMAAEFIREGNYPGLMAYLKNLYKDEVKDAIKHAERFLAVIEAKYADLSPYEKASLYEACCHNRHSLPPGGGYDEYAKRVAGCAVELGIPPR